MLINNTDMSLQGPLVTQSTCYAVHLLRSPLVTRSTCYAVHLLQGPLVTRSTCYANYCRNPTSCKKFLHNLHGQFVGNHFFIAFVSPLQE